MEGRRKRSGAPRHVIEAGAGHGLAAFLDPAGGGFEIELVRLAEGAKDGRRAYDPDEVEAVEAVLAFRGRKAAETFRDVLEAMLAVMPPEPEGKR